MRYAAFLRGVNVGGKGAMKMADLKSLFESLGFTEVKTVLASGNVVFGAEKGTMDMIRDKIEKALEKKYKRTVLVMLRSIDELRLMERSQPFKGVELNEKVRFYVTFLYEASKGVRIPEPDSNYRIVQIRDMNAFTVLELTEDEATPAAMNMLTKVFGPDITTRNWNTVMKVMSA